MAKKWCFMNAVAICLAMGSFCAFAQTAVNPPGFNAGPRPMVSPDKTRESGADRAISQAAQNVGLRTCKPLLDQVNRYLIANNQSWGLLVAAPESASSCSSDC
jgi:hypothetical protein